MPSETKSYCRFQLISENLRNGGTRRQVQDQDLNTSQGRMSVWAAMFQLQSNSISQEPLDTFVELPGTSYYTVGLDSNQEII